MSGCYGRVSPSSPPSEQAAAGEDQAGKARANSGTGDGASQGQRNLQHSGSSATFAIDELEGLVAGRAGVGECLCHGRGRIHFVNDRYSADDQRHAVVVRHRERLAIRHGDHAGEIEYRIVQRITKLIRPRQDGRDAAIAAQKFTNRVEASTDEVDARSTFCRKCHIGRCERNIRGTGVLRRKWIILPNGTRNGVCLCGRGRES